MSEHFSSPAVGLHHTLCQMQADVKMGSYIYSNFFKFRFPLPAVFIIDRHRPVYNAWCADVNTTFVEDIPLDIYFHSFTVIVFWYYVLRNWTVLSGKRIGKFVISNFNLQCIDWGSLWMAILKRYGVDSLIM